MGPISLRSVRFATLLRSLGAVGAKQLSPARKGWVRDTGILSAGGAALRSPRFQRRFSFLRVTR